MNNHRGQWLILSGLILALGLISLVILLNQAMSAGYKVSQAESEFPSHEITEIYEETVRTSNLVWQEVKVSGQNESEFRDNMTDFADNISKIYAAHGTFVEINVTKHSNFTSHPYIANLSMHYYDGKVKFTLGPDRLIQLPAT
jgi:nitrate/TMAO reductase-like tetraheme cytochrome c subunit